MTGGLWPAAPVGVGPVVLYRSGDAPQAGPVGGAGGPSGGGRHTSSRAAPSSRSAGLGPTPLRGPGRLIGTAAGRGSWWPIGDGSPADAGVGDMTAAGPPRTSGSRPGPGSPLRPRTGLVRSPVGGSSLRWAGGPARARPRAPVRTIADLRPRATRTTTEAPRPTPLWAPRAVSTAASAPARARSRAGTGAGTTPRPANPRTSHTRRHPIRGAPWSPGHAVRRYPPAPGQNGIRGPVQAAFAARPSRAAPHRPRPWWLDPPEPAVAVQWQLPWPAWSLGAR